MSRGRTCAVIGLLFASAASAQSYGTEDQTLTVGAAEFQNTEAFDYYYIREDSYLYSGNATDYAAPLALPEGARIEGFCLYAFDDIPTPFKGVSTALYAVKLVPAGEAPIVKAISPEVDSSSNSGYGSSCSTPISYMVRSNLDIDNDEVPDHVAYYVITHIAGERLGLGGVRITWKRQVSPAPQTPRFADVPAADPAFGYVEALAASGITSGCSAGNYCPDATLTRRQMAVFLAKALGLHWPN